MIKRNAHITADDGEQRVLIDIRVHSREGLLLHEVELLRTRIARAVAAVLPGAGLSTTFGAENTRVELGSRQ